MKSVFITIVNFNNDQDSKECLESLEKIVLKDFQISVIVVNNGSEELSFEKNDFKNLPVEIIDNRKNLGFAGGQNIGIKYALDNNADYVLILNNDTYVDKNFLIELLNVIENDEKNGIVSPKIYFAKGYEFHKDRYKENEKGKVIWYAGGIMDWKNLIGSHLGVDEVDNGKFEKDSETDFATGCCMLVKSEVFEKVGLLDDKYFLYYEDNNFSKRAMNKGFKIFFVGKSIIWHKNAGAAGGSGSKLQDYYISRNRLLFGFKYAPFKTKIALIKESIRLLITGREWQKKGILDFYLQRLNKGSYV